MKTSRLIFLDHLKLFCLLLIICGHASSAYFIHSWWYITFPIAEDYASLYFFKYIAFTFCVGLFFFLYGFFIAKSIESHSAYDFLYRRFIPVLFPLLFFIFFISPFLLFFFHLNKQSFSYDFPIYLYNDYFGFGNKPINWDGPTWPEFINLGHLWFIQYYLIFSFIFFIFHFHLKKFLPTISLASPNNKTLFLFSIFLSLAYFTIRIWFPSRFWIFPLFGIPIDPSYLIQYILFFIAGIFAYQNNWNLDFPRVSLKLWVSVISMLLIVVIYYRFYLHINFWSTSGINTKSILASCIEAFLGVAISIVLLKSFKYYLNRKNIITFLSKYSFDIYFLHVPMIVLISLPISGSDMPYLVQILLIVILTIISCVITSILLTYLLSALFKRNDRD